jgi:hypothetical protein
MIFNQINLAEDIQSFIGNRVYDKIVLLLVITKDSMPIIFACEINTMKSMLCMFMAGNIETWWAILNRVNTLSNWI